MSNDRIKNLLNQVKQIVKTHQEHTNKQGENFNIFKILRMERKEVETHSHFIYELLNPKGNHGQESIFLKSFAENVLGCDIDNSAKNPKREDLTENNRRIDFTLETDSTLFGIEMKIDAYDQNNQLFDYREDLLKKANDKEVCLFYLTLYGTEAEECSSKKDEQIVEYTTISFSKHILEWIEDRIAKSAEKSVLREALIQYKILIEKLTGQNMDMNTEIAELIGKDAENFKASLEFEKGLTQAKIDFQIKFWEELLKELGEGYQFGSEYDYGIKSIEEGCRRYYENLRKNKYYGMAYKFHGAESRLMLIVEREVYFQITNPNKEVTELKENININININGWFYPKNIERLDFDNFNSNLVDMLSDDNREKTIQSLADEFKELVKQIENEN